MTTTATLTRFVLETRFDDFPSAVVALAKEHVLDVFGAMLGGYAEPAARIAMDVTRAQGGTPEACVIGGRFRTSIANAAFVNGISGHTLEIEAVGRSPGSDTLTLVATALSLAEKYRLTGKQVIEFVVLGEEFQGRLGLAAPGGSGRGHCGLNLYAPPAIAAACAKVMRLSLEQACMAVGLAISRASGYYRHTGTMAHTHESGLGCKNGVEAALLAAAGMTAAPDLLEGPGGFVELMCNWERGFDLDLATQQLGAPFYILAPGTSTKKYGCCFLVQRPMEALQLIMTEHGLAAADIASVSIDVSPLTRSILSTATPTNGDQAKFSMHHALAAVLADGATPLPYLAPFSDAGALDARYVGVRAKIIVNERSDLAPGLATGAAPPVTVTLHDGRQFTRSAGADVFRGSPELPLAADEMVARYRRCAAAALAPALLDESLDILHGLEQQDDLTRLLEIGTFHTLR